MQSLSIISFAIILINVVCSYKGFSDHSFLKKYVFQVDGILVHKEYQRLVTSGFLHVSWMHLIFNMLSLYFFSEGLVIYIGPLNFLIIYFAALIGGNLLSLFIHRHHGDYSAAGASGAVSGVVFASIALFPGMHISLFILPSMPAWIYGLAYMLYSIYGVRSRSDNVGHDAHLGGGLVGMTAAIIMFPQQAASNILPVLLILAPAAIFIYIIITRPGFLLIDNQYYNKHNYYSIDHKYNHEKTIKQNEFDQMLDKISRRGYSSLSQKEKERLKELSR